jgi:hypothetical protein
MNFIVKILTAVVTAVVGKLGEFLVKSIQDYLQRKKDEREIDGAFKDPNRAGGAGRLDDLFRGGV